MEKEKVFCKYCKYIICFYNEDMPMQCCYPENIVDTWFCEKSLHVHDPSYLNKHNDCSWFEKKE